jgi:glycosyltransferase involved in cell wall biosynthesis
MRTATVLREAAASADHPEAVRPVGGTRARDRARPHLCFVAPHAWPVLSGDPHIQVVGGAEVQQAMLARLFAADDYPVSMICLDFGQPPRVSIDGVQVLRLFRMKAGIPVLRFVHPRLTTMWRRLAEANADVYYCRSASMWVGVVAAFCHRYGRRLIYAGASDKDFVPDVAGQIRYARDRWLYRRGLAAADAIVAQNEIQRADCRRNYAREAVVIPSCYELPRERSVDVRDRVLWVGTINHGKRPELLLELARRLPGRRFVMIGGPSDASPELFERVRAQAVALPNVEFMGFLPLAQAETWFDRARVLVNTSVYEGMPNVFLQAWARAVPTVATVDVNVPPHRVASDVEGLVREVEAVFEDELRGEACRKYFERTHSSAEVLERYARVFDEVLS